MKEVIKTPGRHIEYVATGKSILFGDDDLAVNLKNREKDEAVTLDICSDKSGSLTMGTAAGFKYVAQVEIPARRYNEREVPNPGYDPDAEEGAEAARATTIIREPVPFDIDNCTIYLWGMED